MLQKLMEGVRLIGQTFRKGFHRFYQRHWKRFHPFKMAEWDIISSWLNVQTGMQVLDIACGNGYFARCIGGLSCRVTGIDLSVDGVTEAQLHNRDGFTAFVLGNALHLPFGAACFDKGVSVCAIEHFADDALALSEINRVLKPGGQLVLTVDSLSYDGMGEKFRKACMDRHYVVRTYMQGDLRERLEAAGFEVKSMRYLFNSPGSSFAFKVTTLLHWRGIDLLDPLLYPFLRLLAKVSDQLLGRPDQGYALAANAVKKA